MEDILHNINLIGMKIDPYGIKYFKEKPDCFIKCTDFQVFFKLQKGKRKVTKDNLERIVDMEYLVYSPTSKLFYYKTIHELSNLHRIYNYFKDGNIFIYTAEIQKEKLRILDPESSEVQATDDYLIY